MKREAFKMFLKPGCKEEYKRRHANLFPEPFFLPTRSWKAKVAAKTLAALRFVRSGGHIWLISWRQILTTVPCPFHYQRCST